MTEEVLALYVNRFELKSPDPLEVKAKPTLGGHLVEGKVYMCIKHEENGKQVYRIFFNDEESVHIDGIFIKTLDEDNESWVCDLEEVDFDEIEKYNMSDEDLNYAIDIKTMTLDEARVIMNRKTKDIPADKLSGDIMALLDEALADTPDSEEEEIEYDIVVGDDELPLKPSMNAAINELIGHISGTMEDKYEHSPLNPMLMLEDRRYGKILNIYSANKYLARYLTDGFVKSENRSDLLKAIHHLLIELSRPK